MSDHRLQLLPSIHSSLLGIRDDVEHGDSIESDHLLEVDVASLVPVGVLDREGVVLSQAKTRRQRDFSKKLDATRDEGEREGEELTVPLEFDWKGRRRGKEVNDGVCRLSRGIEKRRITVRELVRTLNKDPYSSPSFALVVTWRKTESVLLSRMV